MPISIAEAKSLIKAAPPEDAILLTGPPGFGKSSAVAQAAAESDWHYWPIYAATLEAVELRGLPHLNNSKAEWAAFRGVLPLADEPHEGVIAINIDDAGQSAPSVLKAIVRTVYGDGTERKCGTHALYPNVRIYGTSNLHTHRAGAHRFETYVTNRVTTVEIAPDPAQWATWALEHGVNPIVVGYVQWSKTITDFAPEKDAFMSPRSLEKLGRFVDSLGAAGINGSILREVTMGTIGAEAGSQFLAYHALSAKLPDMDKLLAGDAVKLPTRPEVQYMLVSTIVRVAEEKHVPVVAGLINKLTETGGTGFEVAAFLTLECVKGSATKLRGVRTRPELYRWLSTYGRYLP